MASLIPACICVNLWLPVAVLRVLRASVVGALVAAKGRGVLAVVNIANPSKVLDFTRLTAYY